MLKLKSKLIEKINSSDNEELLNDIYRLFELEDEASQEKYTFSKDQNKAINDARQQIANGDFLSDEDSNKATDEWLKRK